MIVRLTNFVEELRKKGFVSNEQANLVEAIIKLNEDDQVLARCLMNTWSQCGIDSFKPPILMRNGYYKNTFWAGAPGTAIRRVGTENWDKEKLIKVEKVIDYCEACEDEGTLTLEQMYLIEQVVILKPDDQVFMNRLISRGSDPFSIQYAARGEVSDAVRTAHFNGPSLLEGEDRKDWLFLASLSVDEHGEQLTLIEKVKQMVAAVTNYCNSTEANKTEAINKVQRKIEELDYQLVRIGRCCMRLYTADLGFTSAYWDGKDCAAVRQHDGLTFVGTKPSTSLEDLGIQVDKKLSDQFGIILPKSAHVKYGHEAIVTSCQDCITGCVKCDPFLEEEVDDSAVECREVLPGPNYLPDPTLDEVN